MEKKKIRPITDLRNTNDISMQCHLENEPIFITKNGYDDLVIMSNHTYSNMKKKHKSDYIKDNDLNLIKVACATNEIVVANPILNAKNIIHIIEENKKNNLDILVFPECSVSGYFCGDLFFLDDLLKHVEEGLKMICEATIQNECIIFVGAPILNLDKLYNCAIAIHNGQILGIVPKSNLPNYNEFYESRHFVEYHGENTTVCINNQFVPFGTNLIFCNRYNLKLKIACELCEDLWSIKTPSTNHVLAGANVIVNLSASNELYGKDKTREMLVLSNSYRLNCAYLYASIGNGESTQDLVYSGHNLIAENGVLLKQSKLFSNETIIQTIDLDILVNARRKNTSFKSSQKLEYQTIYFEKKSFTTDLIRNINPYPFLPHHENESLSYAQNIIQLQVMSLVKRLQHIQSKHVILGLSGGLDSTLALIVCYETFKYLNYDFKGIHTILMPCFATSSRTHNNALSLSKIMKTTLKEIPIKDAITLHLKDLQQDILKKNVTYENAQARERTQILFDYANKINGIVIGTGDLSELALGWCTYNGDHMSNYAINCSVPKTLVRFLVQAYANLHEELKEVLYDILNTPISPELLPNDNDQITQITEDIIGPYELHDFFLYYLMKYNFTVKKIYYYAKYAFKDKYNEETIKKWLNVFIKRFFTSQFKRSCVPDGPKVSEISLSPRGDLRMPSDASYQEFLLDE